MRNHYKPCTQAEEAEASSVETGGRHPVSFFASPTPPWLGPGRTPPGFKNDARMRVPCEPTEERQGSSFAPEEAVRSICPQTPLIGPNCMVVALLVVFLQPHLPISMSFPWLFASERRINHPFGRDSPLFALPPALATTTLQAGHLVIQGSESSRFACGIPPQKTLLEVNKGSVLQPLSPQLFPQHGFGWKESPQETLERSFFPGVFLLERVPTDYGGPLSLIKGLIIPCD